MGKPIQCNQQIQEKTPYKNYNPQTLHLDIWASAVSVYIYTYVLDFLAPKQAIYRQMLNTRVVSVQSHFQIIHSPRVPKAIDLTLYELSF